MEPRPLPDTRDFVGPTGNATDKYGGRNPLTRAFVSRFLREIDLSIRIAEPTSILDVGCGEGVVTERMATSTGAPTVGIDLGDEALQVEWRQRQSHTLSFQAASAYDLPFDDLSFDCVCAIEVLEHLERPRDALSEICRVARRTVLLSVPREPVWRVVHLLAGRDVRTLGNTPGHVQHWSSKKFVRLVSEFGTVVDVRQPFPWTVLVLQPNGRAERRRSSATRSSTGAMRVASFASAYPKFEGDPTAPFVASITEHIAARGHTIHVLVPEHAGWKRRPVEGNIRFHPYRYSPSPSWTPWGFSGSLQAGVRIRLPLYALAPLVFLAASRASSSLLGAERCDVVHAHWVVPNGLIAAFVARRHRLPLVVSLHGSDVSVAERSALLGRAARWTFERAAAITAPSEDLIERARRLGAKGILEVIPYGAEVHALQADPEAAAALRIRLGLERDDTIVAGIGRFIHVKGFDYLVEAFAKARAAVPELRLVFVGDGDLRDALASRARSIGVGESVTFAGMVERDEMPAYLAAADIVAVPSIHYGGYVDGLPNVALEAMAAGKPLVATRVGGLPELVRPGENGLLVDEKDADALAEAIVTLARDPDLRARLGRRGQALIREELNWEAVAEKFVSVYERVTASR